MIWALVVVVVSVVAAFLVGVFAYVGASYAFARRHVPSAFAADVREASRELLWALLTQPLLPLFYFVGHRMARATTAEGSARTRRPVVFVHGYAQNRVGFIAIARALRRRGFHDLYGFNYPWWATVAANTKRLAKYVERVAAESGAPRVDLVCHSMGGLIAAEYLRTKEGAERVERCAAIATPYAGVRWRGPIPGRAAPALRTGLALVEADVWTAPTKLLSVYSTHDNVVFPASTSSLARLGGRDLEVGRMGHLAILFDPRAAAAVGDFLSEES